MPKLAEHYNLNPKTIVKCKKRSFVTDPTMGTKQTKSTVSTKEEEAIIVAFRKYTLLLLDDFLYALQATILRLTRSSSHVACKDITLADIPDVDGEAKIKKKRFKQYPIVYFHIDIEEVRT